MIGSLGFTEIAFILVLALLIFGPKRLPEIGRTLGRSLGEFRRATTDLKRSIETELTATEKPAASPPVADRAAPQAAAAPPEPADEPADPAAKPAD